MKKPFLRILMAYGLFTIVFFGLSKIYFHLQFPKQNISRFVHGIFFWGERYLIYFVTVFSVTTGGIVVSWCRENKDYCRLFAYILFFYTGVIGLVALMTN